VGLRVWRRLSGREGLCLRGCEKVGKLGKAWVRIGGWWFSMVEMI